MDVRRKKKKNKFRASMKQGLLEVDFREGNIVVLKNEIELEQDVVLKNEIDELATVLEKKI